MRVVIANASSEPIYEQITRQIRQQIIAGDLVEGEALPSIRRLAKELQVSVITTKRSYDDLEREGFIDTVAGKGTFVAAQNAEFLREKKLTQVEHKLAEAVDDARLYGIEETQLHEMLSLLYKEGDQ